MKTLNKSKILGYGLLPVLIVGIPGFTSQPSNPTPQPIVIAGDCKVEDESRAPIDQEVEWKAPKDGHQYSADFGSRSPFTTNSVAAGSPQAVQATGSCDRTGVYVRWNTPVCYFSYSILKDGQACGKDPGVRVVPPSGSQIVIYFFALALLGTASYFTWRIFLRNRASSRNGSKSGVA